MDIVRLNILGRSTTIYMYGLGWGNCVRSKDVRSTRSTKVDMWKLLGQVSGFGRDLVQPT